VLLACIALGVSMLVSRSRSQGRKVGGGNILIR
jgi:hypothetical protein